MRYISISPPSSPASNLPFLWPTHRPFMLLKWHVSSRRGSKGIWFSVMCCVSHRPCGCFSPTFLLLIFCFDSLKWWIKGSRATDMLKLHSLNATVKCVAECVTALHMLPLVLLIAGWFITAVGFTDLDSAPTVAPHLHFLSCISLDELR